MSDNGASLYENGGCKNGISGLNYPEETWNPAPYNVEDGSNIEQMTVGTGPDRSGGTSESS